MDMANSTVAASEEFATSKPSILNTIRVWELGSFNIAKLNNWLPFKVVIPYGFPNFTADPITNIDI